MTRFEITDKFVKRHIGPSDDEIEQMLGLIGVASIDELIDRTVPAGIRLKSDLKLEQPLSEFEFLNHLRAVSHKNRLYKTYIGMGYYPTITPSVIQRNILENPGWYTQYTPYQAEISQGRLEALLNFQTMVSDLTGLPLTNASLLDEATAAAEAMSMVHSLRKPEKKNANVFFVSDKCFPQTIDVLETRSKPLGIELRTGNWRELDLSEDVFGLLVQYPDGNGEVNDYSEFFELAESKNVFKVVAADLLSLALLKPPGEFNADVVIGSTQRFGIPMGYGGPHAAFFATKDEHKRQVPGRIIGVSIDSKGRPALRMALQTREQHIKRERATSNICTAQVLLAIMAGMYGIYHGADGLKSIAVRINKLTSLIDYGLSQLKIKQNNKHYFDTLEIELENTDEVERLKSIALNHKINFRFFDNVKIGISVGETTLYKNALEILNVFSELRGLKYNESILFDSEKEFKPNIQDKLIRTSKFLTHPVFNKYKTETELMRYIKMLERKDLSLTHSMIALGSCTMKLNAAAELAGISWPEFSQLHPFVPRDQAEGYSYLINQLEKELCEITGFAGVSLQPNSGAQGEYSGLMVIREYHISRGEGHRNVVLIPSSAHGTNPASAVMAGSQVIIVDCDKYGNVKFEDLKEKAYKYKDRLSSLMITYPSTHGVFEHKIKDICDIIHENGGQVYMDGANMNAQVGLTNPAIIGADVCHLNLHKTFTIPHGGGGPGVGPIAVAKHLVQFLPGHSVVKINDTNSMSAVSSAPWGSAGILLISYAYIMMMGSEGLRRATEVAILNANYIKCKLENIYPVLYTGKRGFVGHELIFDLRGFKSSANVDVEDVAKRLMDYGYHAPTVSFPVPGTIMVEPTESESKEELDRFCEAMILIKNEIDEITNGTLDKIDNPLKNAPHTAADVVNDNWIHSYSRKKAAFPAPWCIENKFWPSVGRINNAYGDRNLVCTCLPTEAYQTTGHGHV